MQSNDIRCITLIVPWDACRHIGTNALIVQGKIETGGLLRSRKPSKAAVAFNRTAKYDGPQREMLLYVLG